MTMAARISRLLLLLFLTAVTAAAESGLDARQFKKYWRVESESSDYTVSFRSDTAEVLSPKGLTLWRKEKLKADIAVEYDVCVLDEGRNGDRLSDMNVFWLASDPEAKDIWARAGWRSGIFTRCYTLQMYYLGYGGNSNTTTRFRRYTGDARGVDSAGYRPAILKEYTDTKHLLKANHWYHIRIESAGGRTTMTIDGEPIVSYLDPQPLTEGWFGFRTTWSRIRITNFRIMPIGQYSFKTGIPLHWIGKTPSNPQPVSFGIPFAPGELREVSNTDRFDCWVNARWPDGSVKWAGVSTVASPSDNLSFRMNSKKDKEQNRMDTRVTDTQLQIGTGRMKAYLPRKGSNILDSLILDGVRVGGSAWLVASFNYKEPLNESKEPLNESKEPLDEPGMPLVEKEVPLVSQIDTVVLERSGNVSAVVKVEGHHLSNEKRQCLPFTLRLYFWKGSEQVKLVHSFVYDGDEHRDNISSLGIRFNVPLRDELYNRHVAFATDNGDGVWAEPVQPLTGRRWLSDPQAERRQLQGERIAAYESFNAIDRQLLDNWAAWDGYRLSQLTDNSFSVRKRATSASPWIGTFTGQRAPGYAFVGDASGGLGVGLKDFWQSYPSTLQIDQARNEEAAVTAWMWSPEAEPMNLCHYDTIAHSLQASYEDVQPGMSSPYGIARTSVLWLFPQTGYPGKPQVAATAAQIVHDALLLPTPEYLHQKQAFGLWSLPKADSSHVERRLSEYLEFYRNAIEQHKWYGFWNYGDLMHAYDPVRHSWQYDVGGYAWDNTELATPMWLWYSFLRTSRKDVWQMAEAMTRHNAEVDTYHLGPFAPLGSRHNVSHWGCGAKEARISQSAFLRFYYYLTCDERTGDLMHAQTDADTLLYHLDPMRLAEPRSMFPCSAPARLRIGPDWLAYAGNWMTEWERTGNKYYLDKICNGLQSISRLSDGLFTGNKALGYYPDTGLITYEGDTQRKNTNHLATIMGGFEVMNEMLTIIPEATRRQFQPVWLDHARRYKQMALEISRNRFPVRRLMAYAAWQTRSPQLAAETWNDLWSRIEHEAAPQFSIRKILPPEVAAPIDEWNGLSTNDAALWSLDAIYLQEVLER